MDITYLLLFFTGALAFIVSTVGGGGGALLLLPTTSFLIGSGSVAPVVQLATFIGRPVRLVLFWKEIDWKVVKYYLPSALIGGFLGAYLFTQLQIKWIQLVLGIFLVSTVFQFRFGKKKRSFPMLGWYFAPLGFVFAFLSSLIGGGGPVLNPFYLNYGLEKEAMIATKTANSFFVAIVQIGTYSFYGALEGTLWLYGLWMGLGTALGNWLGKWALSKMSAQNFRQAVIFVMVVSGILMIVKAMGEG